MCYKCIIYALIYKTYLYIYMHEYAMHHHIPMYASAITDAHHIATQT